MLSEEDENRQFWVGQVLEIRASDTHHVYLRIFWMYWPEDLPTGRLEYHGKHEIVASNHMEIVDAMTVSEQAVVEHYRYVTCNLVISQVWA